MPKFVQLAIGTIDPPPLPIRAAMDEALLQELADDIRAQGVLQPISVETNGTRFVIQMGHRRFLASQLAGKATIPALVYKPGELDTAQAMLGENSFREEMGDAELAIWLHEIQEKHNCTEEELCKRVRRSPDWCATRLRLVVGDPEVFAALSRREIKLGHAVAINRLDNPKARALVLSDTIRSTPPVRIVEQWVRDWQAQDSGGPDKFAAPEPVAAGAAPPLPTMSCFWCGGGIDTWNLINVWVHKHEYEMLLKIRDESAKG